MQVEVNEANIDRYNLVEYTGNDREFMLSKAAEARETGHILSVEVPDDLVLEQNVFDVYKEEHVDPRRIETCRYDQNIAGEWICVVHNEPSQYAVDASSEKPCQKIEPMVMPKVDVRGRTCAYSKLDDPVEGTVHFCLVHGATSKYDVVNNPGLPCRVIDKD